MISPRPYDSRQVLAPVVAAGQSASIPNPRAVQIPAGVAPGLVLPLSSAVREGRLTDPDAVAVVRLLEAAAFLAESNVWGAESVLVAVGRRVAQLFVPFLAGWVERLAETGNVELPLVQRGVAYIIACAGDSSTFDPNVDFDMLLNVKDVVARSGVTQSAVRQAAQSGRLVGAKRGARWLFTSRDVDAWLRWREGRAG